MGSIKEYDSNCFSSQAFNQSILTTETIVTEV